MKIASYNFQNIFYRHIDLVKCYREKRLPDWKEEFESIQLKRCKNENELNRLRELAVLIGFHNDTGFENVHLENIEGEVFYSPLIDNRQGHGNSTKNWVGWAKSKSISIPEKSITNKAKVIIDCSADILIIQEVENRLALSHFNKVNLKQAYAEVFFMEGNSRKNRGLGILLKKGFNLKTINSFANEKNASGGNLFENDVQLYTVSTPSNKEVFILNTLLDGHSLSAKTTERFNKLYALVEMCVHTNENFVLAGTLGLPSFNKHVRVFIERFLLKQINAHKNFEVTLDTGSDSSYYRLGAYTKGVNIKQQDYLMVSSKLFENTQNCGLNRKGIWPGKRPKWDTYQSMNGELNMASEHPLLWSEFK